MKSLLNVLLFVFIFPVYAQNQAFKGTISDAVSKAPLPFTNIFVENQQRGTVSNSEGKFVLSSEDIVPDDIISFSYMGYNTYKITAKELKETHQIYLRPSVTELKEVEVNSRPLTAEEIIDLVIENYPENHPETNEKRHMYYHHYEKTPFSDHNKITLKESDFVGLDKTLFNDVFEQLPNTFIEYQDAVLDLYTLEEQHKLTPIEAISLEEGSMEKLAQEMEKKLSAFFTDIEQTTQNKDTYYQFKTGILGFKFGKEGVDSSWSTHRKDTINYHVPTTYLKTEIHSLLKNYTDPESDNWEFLTQPKKYRYTKENITVFNEELIYVISFVPEQKGVFQGKIYVSATTYGLLQLDFEFAEGKQTEKFQLLGIGHAINYKKGRVIYEKKDSTYALKYIQAQQQEIASVDRKFTVKKKEKRFFIDKKLNQIKLHASLFFDINSTKEILFLDRSDLDKNTFENITEPKTIKFKKEYAHSPDIWKNRTVIAPAKALKNYKSENDTNP